MLQEGPDKNNCWVAYTPDTFDCAVIDPGCNIDMLLKACEEYKVNITSVYCTNGFPFSILSAARIQSMFEVPVFIHKGK